METGQDPTCRLSPSIEPTRGTPVRQPRRQASNHRNWSRQGPCHYSKGSAGLAALSEVDTISPMETDGTGEMRCAPISQAVLRRGDASQRSDEQGVESQVRLLMRIRGDNGLKNCPFESSVSPERREKNKEGRESLLPGAMYHPCVGPCRTRTAMTCFITVVLKFEKLLRPPEPVWAILSDHPGRDGREAEPRNQGSMWGFRGSRRGGHRHHHMVNTPEMASSDNPANFLSGPCIYHPEIRSSLLTCPPKMCPKYIYLPPLGIPVGTFSIPRHVRLTETA